MIKTRIINIKTGKISDEILGESEKLKLYSPTVVGKKQNIKIEFLYYPLSKRKEHVLDGFKLYT